MTVYKLAGYRYLTPEMAEDERYRAEVEAEALAELREHLLRRLSEQISYDDAQG